MERGLGVLGTWGPGARMPCAHRGMRACRAIEPAPRRSVNRTRKLYHRGVARKQPKRKATPPVAPRWHVTALGVLFLLVQLAVLPGAASAFRTPKAALVVIGITAIVAFATVGRLRRNRLRLPSGRLAIVLMMLPALQATSALWSHSPLTALATAITSAVWVTGILWMATIEPGDRDRIIAWCAAGTAISAGVLLLQASGMRILDFTESVRGRFELTGLAGNPADLSMAAVLLLPLLLRRSENSSHRWRMWGLLCLLVVGAMVSQTLTAYVALGLLLLVWLVGARSWWLWLGTTVVMAAALAAAFASGLDRRLTSKLEQLESGNLYSLLSARTDGWTAAAEMVQARPVTGVGAGNFTIEFYPSRLDWLISHGTSGERGQYQTHFEWAHCDPLQHVAELGAGGWIWIIALCWALAHSWSRASRLIALAAAATGPFLLLHYPTHLALGLVPTALVLADLVDLGGKEMPLTVRSRALRAVTMWGLVIVVVAMVMWQTRHLALDLWRGDLDRRLVVAQSIADANQRGRAAATVEFQVMRRIHRLPGAAPWLWRDVGRARLLRNDARAAESAFRTAQVLWPHEEAEFGLGLALAAQNRRNEALVHLGNVCRVNRSLVRRIPDPGLQRAVLDLLEATSMHQHVDR